MDPTSGTLPIAGIQPTTPHAGGHQQRSPFAQGQLLHGVISAQTGPHQFTLALNNQQVPVESAAPLQVGQQLHLQVAALTPRVELQIVPADPLAGKIGGTLHLLGHQQHTLAELPALAADARSLAQAERLSATALSTINLYADQFAALAPAEGSPPSPLIARLLHLAGEAATTPLGTTPAPLYREMGGLLQQFAAESPLSPQSAESAATLANVLLRAGDNQGAAPFLPPAALDLLLGQAGRTAADGAPAPPIEPGLLALLQKTADLPALHPLRQLLAFLATAPSASAQPVEYRPDGQQLATLIDRLGIGMERLLLEGNQEEAVRTLKAALLELSGQLAGAEKSPAPAEQMVKTIELFQMLQIRLASEALFFLPLPLPFLDQGYLLINPDQAGEQPEDERRRGHQGSRQVELHLRLEGLGNLEVTILREQDRLSLKFMAEDTERARFIAGFRDELANWLTAGQLTSVQFLGGAQEPAKTLLHKLTRGSDGSMINTRV